MADNIIYIPFLNPVQFVDLSPAEVPAYLTRGFNDYLFSVQLAAQSWNEQVSYVQKWQTSDVIKFQFEANYSPLNISLIDKDENVITAVTAQNILSNKYEAGLYVFEAEISIAGIDEGCYYLKLECG